MNSLDLGRYALSTCAVVVMLAGCGGSQPPIGTPGLMPQSRAISPAHAVADHVGGALSYKVLYNFGGVPDGARPSASLLDVDGVLYSTTAKGGKLIRRHEFGTVFSVSTTGAEQVLYRFGPHPDGSRSSAGLIDVDGTFYGTTANGGKSYVGTVFSVDTAGKEHVLYSFTGSPNADRPEASLTDVSGTLYGTTYYGGTRDDGTVFSVTTGGLVKVLYSFGGRFDGTNPSTNLIVVEGKLYGTTAFGGRYGKGTVFSVSTAGKEHKLHDFRGTSTDGYWPTKGLTDLKGTLYGTTLYGGEHHSGTVFSITTSGAESALYSFGATKTDGYYPEAGLTYVGDTLYGTTGGGGRRNAGTVFSISTVGAEHVLHSFGGRSDGKLPLASLIDMNGTLYGTTTAGGTHNEGTVFALKP